MANPILTINQEALTNYVAVLEAENQYLDEYLPFDIDGDKGQWIKEKHPGVDFILGDSLSMTGNYQLQVESTESGQLCNYQSGSTFPAREYCESLREGGYTDWRLPTLIELYIMWDKAKGNNNDASDDEVDSFTYGARFLAHYYWSCSADIYSGRCVLGFNHGVITTGVGGSYVRCVRDIN